MRILPHMSVYRRGPLDLFSFDRPVSPDDRGVACIDLSDVSFVDAYGLVCLASQGPRRGSVAAPTSEACLGHVWATAHRDRAVPSGHQRDVVPQVAGAVLGNMPGGRALIAMRRSHPLRLRRCSRSQAPPARAEGAGERLLRMVPLYVESSAVLWACRLARECALGAVASWDADGRDPRRPTRVGRGGLREPGRHGRAAIWPVPSAVEGHAAGEPGRCMPTAKSKLSVTAITTATRAPGDSAATVRTSPADDLSQGRQRAHGAGVVPLDR
jgi:hypothetical protein